MRTIKCTLLFLDSYLHHLSLSLWEPHVRSNMMLRITVRVSNVPSPPAPIPSFFLNLFPSLQWIFPPFSLHQAKSAGTLAAWSFAALLGCDRGIKALVERLVVMAVHGSFQEPGCREGCGAVLAPARRHGERHSRPSRTAAFQV